MLEKRIQSILVLIAASWGEIDWILPVCRYIKDNYPQVVISAIFESYDREDIIRGNTFLSDLLTESVDSCYDLGSFLPPLMRRFLDIVNPHTYPHNLVVKVMWYARYKILTFVYGYFAKGLEERIVALTNPDVFLKQVGGNVGISGQITSLVRKRGGSIIIVPHATTLSAEEAVPSRAEMVYHDVDGDIILCTSDNMSKLYGGMHRLKTAVIGNPRYDSWWIDYVQNYWKQKNYSVKWDPSKQYTILFITRGPHPIYLSRQTFEYLINETARVVLSLPDTYLVVRPHPRCPTALLQECLKPYNKSRWTIDATNIFCLAGSMDLAISMWSSAALDVLAVGIPVIEFFRFEGSNFQWSREKDGSLTTGYRKLGLVASANNGEELLFWINKFRNEPDVELKKQLTNFRKEVPESVDSATRLVTDFILGKWKEA